MSRSQGRRPMVNLCIIVNLCTCSRGIGGDLHMVCPAEVPSAYHPKVCKSARGRIAAGVMTGSGTGAGPALICGARISTMSAAVFARKPIFTKCDRNRMLVKECRFQIKGLKKQRGGARPAAGPDQFKVCARNQASRLCFRKLGKLSS